MATMITPPNNSIYSAPPCPPSSFKKLILSYLQ
jgi:hypothetical protein